MSGASDYKRSVVVATTANIALSGLQTIDGIVLTNNTLVLVKNQSTGSQNGIYLARAAAWVRSNDTNSDKDVTSGATVYVSRGAVNQKKHFVLTTVDPITLGSTALVFEEFGAQGADGAPGADGADGTDILGLENTFTGHNTFTEKVVTPSIQIDGVTLDTSFGTLQINNAVETTGSLTVGDSPTDSFVSNGDIFRAHNTVEDGLQQAHHAPPSGGTLADSESAIAALTSALIRHGFMASS